MNNQVQEISNKFVKKKISRMIEELNDKDLHQVVEYMIFLKFRSQFHDNSLQNDNELARLYGEFNEMESIEAEEGMEEYKNLLAVEDVQ